MKKVTTQRRETLAWSETEAVLGDIYTRHHVKHVAIDVLEDGGRYWPVVADDVIVSGTYTDPYGVASDGTLVIPKTGCLSAATALMFAALEVDRQDAEALALRLEVESRKATDACLSRSAGSALARIDAKYARQAGRGTDVLLRMYDLDGSIINKIYAAVGL